MSSAADHPDPPPTASRGLSFAPFRGLRPRVDNERVAHLLCPPYDVIDAHLRQELLEQDPDNAVAVVLPAPTPNGYAAAAARLAELIDTGVLATDDSDAFYIYEMREADGSATRGLMGAVELRDPTDGVILPHENTMAGPVADRLAVMTATGADLEPIYLVYDGGGATSELVGQVDKDSPTAEATTGDGITHRLWTIAEPEAQHAVVADLRTRRALIADGHHRYATYRERQRLCRESDGPGPWDRGLALLVDTSEYGPQVHAIHRVIAGQDLAEAVGRLDGWAKVNLGDNPTATLAAAAGHAGFAAVLTDGSNTFLVEDPSGSLANAAARPGDLDALTELDVTLVHHGLVERIWGLTDDVDTVGYAHSVDEAIALARERHGFAILLRATPVEAVAAVAAAGARMPRKSTLFTPKPASGLVMRRLDDQRG